MAVAIEGVVVAIVVGVVVEMAPAPSNDGVVVASGVVVETLSCNPGALKRSSGITPDLPTPWVRSSFNRALVFGPILPYPVVSDEPCETIPSLVCHRCTALSVKEPKYPVVSPSGYMSLSLARNCWRSRTSSPNEPRERERTNAGREDSGSSTSEALTEEGMAEEGELEGVVAPIPESGVMVDVPPSSTSCC